MFVPLPNLDDRRWRDLVDEGRALLPVYAPEWTDHNLHDPGITLMELFAWLTEGQIYEANRVTDAHRLAFLSLLGNEPSGPQAAVAVVECRLNEHGEPTSLPAGVEFEAAGANGRPIRFRTERDVFVGHAALLGIQCEQGGLFRDLTPLVVAGQPLPVLGDDPRVGSALYLGFDQLSGGSLDLAVELSGVAADAERSRIEEERRASDAGCGVPRTCRDEPPHRRKSDRSRLVAHHSATIVWESRSAQGHWLPLEALDDTRALTLSGGVHLRFRNGVPPAALGKIATPLCYIRARLAEGALDAAPIARRIVVHAVRVRQATALRGTWSIAAGVLPSGASVGIGSTVHLDFNDKNEVSALGFGDDLDAPALEVDAYMPPVATGPGRISVAAQRLGAGSGAPNQIFRVEDPLIYESVSVYTVEHGYWLRWERTINLARSGAADRHFVITDQGASFLFGDGQHGRVPPSGAVVIAVGNSTVAARGNVGARKIVSIPDTAANRLRLPKFAAIVKSLTVGNPDAAYGGADAETPAQAEGRLAVERDRATRAVTAKDCEVLALETPGTRIARAAAHASHHPDFPCYTAPGFTTLIVVPSLPAGRPEPSPGLCAAVSAYLNRRRLLGTRVLVTGPEYLQVSVRATVHLFAGQSRTRVTDATVRAIQQFFDPLRGGPDGKGWPLGRDVFRSEVLEAIDAVPGVDHVVSLDLIATGCGAQCGNICLPANGLVASGQHEITVM